MSLQVWLPLNGDLTNNGLAITTFSGTPVWKTYGKLSGKSLNLQNRITCSTPSLNGVQFFSIAFWGRIEANTDSTANWMDVIGFTDISTDETSGQFRFETGYGNTAYGGIHWHDNATNAIINGSYTYNTASEYNNWHHIVVTVSDTAVKSYYDGELKQTHTTSLNKGHLNGNWWLGESTTRGCIQDVRIYDHALSDKEVKELSKCLILHYKLDDMASIQTITNICNGSTCGTQASAAAPSTWGAHKYYTILQNTTSNDPVPFLQKSVMTIDYNTSYGSNGGASVYPPTSFVIEPSTTYVYSKYIKPSDDFAYVHANFLYRYEYPSGGGTRLIEGGVFSKTNTEYLGNGWYRCWGTFTSQSTAASVTLPFYTYPGKSMTYELGGVMLEKGTTLSPYVSASNIPICYDSSGYQNNGTPVGNIKLSNDTARYSCSMKQANGQYVRVEKRPAECMPKDAITVNFWQYATSWSNPISCTEGGGWNFENNNGIRFPVYISGVGYKVAQSSITTASTLNAWHMLTGTMDKDNVKIYYDGQEVGTIATESTNGIGYANNYIFIGGEASGNQLTPASSAYTGNLSDVRIYATALSPEDILELYNTSASIDNNGNIYSRELVEI